MGSDTSTAVNDAIQDFGSIGEEQLDAEDMLNEEEVLDGEDEDDPCEDELDIPAPGDLVEG